MPYSEYHIKITSGQMYYWAGYPTAVGTILVDFDQPGSGAVPASPADGWPGAWTDETLWVATEDGVLDLRDLHPQHSFSSGDLSFQFPGGTITLDDIRTEAPASYSPINTEGIDTNQLPNQIPLFANHEQASTFYRAIWKGTTSSGTGLPLKSGLLYTDGTRLYKSLSAATAQESWVDANEFDDLAGLVAGFKAQLAALVSANGPLTLDSANGLIFGLDENAVNAGQLNGQTAAEIIESARDRMNVYRVYSLLNPSTDAIPSVEGRRFATTASGNGLSRTTIYEIQGGVPVEITALVPGDYALEEGEADSADKSWITKTDPDTQQFRLYPSGEDELTAAQLALILLLEAFGGQRMVDLLTALEGFGVANLRSPEQIRQIAEGEVDILETVLQALTTFGIQRAVDLLTALEAKGVANLATISQMNTAIADFYTSHNIWIDFDPSQGSPDPASDYYQMPLNAPLTHMTVNAVPAGFSAGTVFKNGDTVGPATNWRIFG